MLPVNTIRKNSISSLLFLFFALACSEEESSPHYEFTFDDTVNNVHHTRCGLAGSSYFIEAHTVADYLSVDNVHCVVLFFQANGVPSEGTYDLDVNKSHLGYAQVLWNNVADGYPNGYTSLSGEAIVTMHKGKPVVEFNNIEMRNDENGSLSRISGKFGCN
jgi:hypothetical protein